MAPRKEKTEKTMADQGAAMVLDYLRKQNRPYSAADISSNLHNKISKAHAAKFLKEMHERKEIEGKVAGKQIVYHSLQDDPTSTTEDLTELESTLNTLREDLAIAKAKEKTLKSEIAVLSSVITAGDLRATVEALQTQKAGLLKGLEELKKVEVTPVSEKEKVAAEDALKMWKKHAVTRKNIVKELWYKCLEGLPEGMKKEELWDQLGCDGKIP